MTDEIPEYLGAAHPEGLAWHKQAMERLAKEPLTDQERSERTASYVKYLKNEHFNNLLATKVMGWTKEFVCRDPETYGGAVHHWCDADGDRVAWATGYIDNEPWSPSTDIKAARMLMMKLAHLVGDFQTGDGFFYLVYAEAANHEICTGCDPGDGEYSGDENDKDLTPWTAHIHIGLAGENPTLPAGWTDGAKFCARGETPELAICNVALKAFGIEVPA